MRVLLRSVSKIFVTVSPSQVSSDLSAWLGWPLVDSDFTNSSLFSQSLKTPDDMAEKLAPESKRQEVETDLCG